MDTIITAENLAGGYVDNAVWRDANFSIRRGEFVAVLGPNGAGKTTLFQLLLGLTKPSEGTLTLFGSTPSRGNPRIGYVPQHHGLDRDMRIEALELVRLGLEGSRWGIGLSRKVRKAAMEALEVTGADGLAHRALGTLSGGELQRVFLAEALVSKPDLLLLDEPLANLDLRREMDFVRLIDTVVRSQCVTVLLITHNINPLLPVLDRVMYIAHGGIVAGAPHEVLTSETLSSLYDAPIEVLRDSHGRIAVVGAEESPHHHD